MEKFAIDLDKVLDDFEFNEGKNYYLILFYIIKRNISMSKIIKELVILFFFLIF